MKTILHDGSPEIVSSTATEIENRIVEEMKRFIRNEFDNACQESHMLACIKVARDLTYDELADEMESDLSDYDDRDEEPFEPYSEDDYIQDGRMYR